MFKTCFSSQRMYQQKKGKKNKLKHIIIHDMHAHLIMQMIHANYNAWNFINLCENQNSIETRYYVWFILMPNKPIGLKFLGCNVPSYHVCTKSDTKC